LQVRRFVKKPVCQVAKKSNGVITAKDLKIHPGKDATGPNQIKCSPPSATCFFRIETWINSSQRRSLVIDLRVVGILTIFGAGYIIQGIAKDAARRKPTKNRIILVMSICDFLNALVTSVLGTSMVPKGIWVPGAVGNQLSWDAQGFLTYTTGMASGSYNVSLALC
jgi:hypothetical protein